jgi:hypothetical protein
MLLASAAAFAGISFSATEAHAIEPIPQGTLAISAERLASSHFYFYNGGPDWNNQFFGAPTGGSPLSAPRLGADYFIIDGLSIGGTAAAGFTVNDGDGAGYFSLIPRVGYAFHLGGIIDFWPRLGVGFIVGNVYPDTGVIDLEAMFLANLTDYFAIEFGPALDVPFAQAWPDVIVGANAGLVVTF